MITIDFCAENTYTVIDKLNAIVGRVSADGYDREEAGSWKCFSYQLRRNAGKAQIQ